MDRRAGAPLKGLLHELVTGPPICAATQAKVATPTSSRTASLTSSRPAQRDAGEQPMRREAVETPRASQAGRATNVRRKPLQ